MGRAGLPVLTIEEVTKRWLSFNVREDRLAGTSVGREWMCGLAASAALLTQSQHRQLFAPKPVGLAVDTVPAGHLPPCLTALVEKPVNKGSWPALETITALPIDIVREYDGVGRCVEMTDDRVRKCLCADPPDQPPLSRTAALRAWHSSRHDSDSLPSEIGRSGYWCGQGSSRSIHAILARRSPALSRRDYCQH